MILNARDFIGRFSILIIFTFAGVTHAQEKSPLPACSVAVSDVLKVSYDSKGNLQELVSSGQRLLMIYTESTIEISRTMTIETEKGPKGVPKIWTVYNRVSGKIAQINAYRDFIHNQLQTRFELPSNAKFEKDAEGNHVYRGPYQTTYNYTPRKHGVARVIFAEPLNILQENMIEFLGVKYPVKCQPKGVDAQPVPLAAPSGQLYQELD